MNTRMKLAVLLALTLLFAACSTGAQESGAAPTAAPPTATATEPVPTATANEPEAAATEASVAAQTPAEDPGEDRLVRFAIVPEETTARYSIEEVFLSDNNTLATAVGVTSQVQGGMTLNYDDPSASEFEPIVVDISTLQSDRSRRDRAIRSEWLESATYPLATLEVTEVRGFPADPQEDVPMTFQLAGDMTVKETTREVVWDVTATLSGDRLTGTATLDTFLADFNIPIPSIAGVLRVTDGITLTLEFVMEKVAE